MGHLLLVMTQNKGAGRRIGWLGLYFLLGKTKTARNGEKIM